MTKQTSKLKTVGGGLAAFLVFSVPLLAGAETVVRTGNSVSIGVDQVVNNDLYTAAGSVALSGEVKADVYAAGGSVTINGPIGADLTVVGGTVQAHSKVEDDVRVIGGDVVVAGDVGGDIFVLGGHLKLLSSANVGGNLYFYGGEAEIEGSVTGSVMGQAGEFRIDGPVGGVDVSADSVTLGTRASVAGDVRYQSVSDIERAIGASVSGNLTKVDPGEQPVPPKSDPSLIIALVWVLTSLSLLLVGKQFLPRLLKNIKNDPVRTGLVGLLAAIAAPAVGVMLIATIIGAWAGIALLIFTAFLFMVALALLPILLGGYLFNLYRPTAPMGLVSSLLGLLIVIFLTQLPFIGGVLIFTGLVFTIGALLQSVYKIIKGAA